MSIARIIYAHPQVLAGQSVDWDAAADVWTTDSVDGIVRFRIGHSAVMFN